ncbi:DNA-binding transcriptional regulator YdaS (Cro superfamily) [Dyadobacter sp. BE34]|nr:MULTISPECIES: hypothetical protein [Dyadobacter]MDR7197009.1 DNA-binding transcriptional regulator YdaS (Cro superfamily) [Dyadobacter sp. BE34]MDR7215556.1 DNA-binding transcriptional regulator YdaS (Cro superfamily) [Dyadobacter sp. BE31]
MKDVDIKKSPDFKESVGKVLNELSKRRIKNKFYVRLGYSPAIVSMWRNGKRNILPEQEKLLFETAIEVIKEHEEEVKAFQKERKSLFSQFESLVAAAE